MGCDRGCEADLAHYAVFPTEVACHLLQGLLQNRTWVGNNSFFYRYFGVVFPLPLFSLSGHPRMTWEYVQALMVSARSHP